jgi:hypothetical protein
MSGFRIQMIYYCDKKMFNIIFNEQKTSWKLIHKARLRSEFCKLA